MLTEHSWVYQGETSPNYSEIDILENVNLQTANTHSFYTSEKCTVNVQKGNLVPEKSTNCHWELNGPSSQGCSFNAEQGTFNQPFNDQHKVVAMQVESERMRIWHFKKNEVPSDLNSANPNPDAWTKAPSVHLTPKSCDFNKAFRMFHIVSREKALNTFLFAFLHGCILQFRDSNNFRSSTSPSVAAGLAMILATRPTLGSAPNKQAPTTAGPGSAKIRATSPTLTLSSTQSSCSKGRRIMN